MGVEPERIVGDLVPRAGGDALARDVVVTIDRTTLMPIATFLATSFDTPDGQDVVLVVGGRRIELHVNRREPGPDGLTYAWVMNGTAG